MTIKSIDKWQYGDFQTPDGLACAVVENLKRNHHIKPSVVIEPSCGKGAFIRAAMEGFTDAKVLGFDINQDYINAAHLSLGNNNHRVGLNHADFFDVDWNVIIADQIGFILVIGNPPCFIF